MDVSPAIGLSAILFLVLANGFFVATEFAIVAVRRSRLEELITEKRAGATAAAAVVSQLDAYIAATQFGVTLASLALGWIGEPALAHLIQAGLGIVTDRLGATTAHGAAIGVSFVMITALHIVVGELAPKGLALQRPEATTLLVARPIQLFHTVFKWPISTLNMVGNSTLRLLGVSPAAGHETAHSVEELRLLVTGMQKAGVVDHTEARLAQRAFDFSDRTASSLMIPRVAIDAVPVTASLEELLRTAERTRHTRLPVYEGSVDNIIGYFHVRELFKFTGVSSQHFSLGELLHAPLVIPETRDAADVLEDMRQQHSQLAVVVDEYGGTAGIITLADLLRALVGRIDDEPEMAAVEDLIRVEADGSLVLDGLMRLHDFAEATGIRLDDEYEGVDTLGGLVVSMLGRFPASGERLTLKDRTMIVELHDGHRVERLRLLAGSPTSA